jgi:ketosteroid isomerase-like protein
MRLRVVLMTAALVWPPVFLQAQAPLSQALPSVDLPPDVERVLRDYEQAWTAGDALGMADLFTEDGFSLRPGRPPARGRAAILRLYQNAGGRLALRPLDFAVSDSIGYIVGAFATQPGEPDLGKFVLLIRRGPSGRWLIAADIDNGN